MIYDKDALTKEVFPAYFKHSNFKSFARQLNFYGFRKIKSKEKEWCIYHHDCFQINRADLLTHIQRQTNENHHDTHTLVGTQNVSTTLVASEEVNELKDKVNTLTTTISSLRQEISDLKSLVVSLAEVVRGHDDFIRQPHNSQVVHPSAVSASINCLHTQANFDHNTANSESLKPQAKQTTSPNHDSIKSIESLQDTHASYSYVAMTQRQDLDLHPSKRQKFSDEESVAYAPVTAQHQFAIPPPATMPGLTSQPTYENRHDHWTNHTSDNFTNHRRHHINNEQRVHNISISSIDNESSSATVAPHNVAECSADQDYGFEDLAWFALFEEDISHQPDDPTAAPQA